MKDQTTIDFTSGRLKGNVIKSEKKLSELQNIFRDETERSIMNQETIVYRVQMHDVEKAATEGGLLFGTSFVYPGMVGNEYFMTKGHFHKKIDRAEYYWCIKGTGILLLMDENRKLSFEPMYSGSLHYIKGRVAHRLVNTGDVILTVGACWPSDAGHDYQTITDHGFSARVLCIEDKPMLIDEASLGRNQWK